MNNDLADVTTLTVYRFIYEYTQKKGFSPSHKEMARGAFISPTTLLTHLVRLEAHGWIVREFNIPRSVRLGEFAPDPEADLFADLWEAAHAPVDEPLLDEF
ncbi:MAG: hypothetical protein AAFV98_20450 [Chloroflexota bacterium]